MVNIGTSFQINPLKFGVFQVMTSTRPKKKEKKEIELPSRNYLGLMHIPVGTKSSRNTVSNSSFHHL